ncbi:hypothetical protein Tco_0491452 [Tanacetum coccineum]
MSTSNNSTNSNQQTLADSGANEKKTLQCFEKNMWGNIIMGKFIRSFWITSIRRDRIVGIQYKMGPYQRPFAFGTTIFSHQGQKKAAKNHDPLALIAHSNASFITLSANTSILHTILRTHILHQSLIMMMNIKGSYKRRNRIQGFNTGNAGDESNQIIQCVPRIESTLGKANIQCYNYNEKGHYARESGLGYTNPEHLKKAIAAQPKMYDGDLIHSNKLVIHSTDSEETLEDAEESRTK